jgi:tRNA dimethylallyltransferase
MVAHRGANALNTVGYKELFAHLDGTLSLDEAVHLIKQNTRRFAKRQLTWFRAQPDVRWQSPLA